MNHFGTARDTLNMKIEEIKYGFRRNLTNAEINKRYRNHFKRLYPNTNRVAALNKAFWNFTKRAPPVMQKKTGPRVLPPR